MMVSKGETLLSPSSVKLYGRVVKGLTISLDDARDELGNNRFLRNQLDRDLNDEFEPVLARIYGYSYLGQYQPLKTASLFLVHGEGDLAAPLAAIVDSNGKFGIDTDPDGEPGAAKARLATASSSVDASGVAAKNWEFSSDIRVWEYDRADFSLRLDVESGPLERILLGREEGGDEMPYFRGQRTRLRGPGE